MSEVAGPHPFFEALIVWATPEASKPDLVEARKAWLARTGEVFDDDKALEPRMALFLEAYVCDRVAPHLGKTPARARYELALREDGPAGAAGFRALTDTVRSLFEVLSLDGGVVKLRELFTQITWDVRERRTLAGLEKGDVLEARLIDFGGAVSFSGSWIWHPHAAARAIKAEARRVAAAGADPFALVDDCAQRALRVDRYRQISVEKIYDFSARKPGAPHLTSSSST